MLYNINERINDINALFWQILKLFTLPVPAKIPLISTNAVANVNFIRTHCTQVSRKHSFICICCICITSGTFIIYVYFLKAFYVNDSYMTRWYIFFVLGEFPPIPHVLSYL